MNPRARRALAGALARTLEDERAFAAVAKSARTVKQMRPELGDAIVDAVGATQRQDAVQALCAFLDQGDARDARVLAHLGRLADAHPWWPVEGLGRVAESFLEHPDRDVRKAAAALLGRVGTLESVPQLAPLSEDGDATVRRTALWALGEVSGRPGAFDGAERWVAWSVEERQRLKRDLPGIQAALAADDPAVVLAGARDLAARRAYRRKAAVVLAELLAAKPELAAPLASLIVQTGARTAVPSLVDALFSSDARVVDAALRALHALTGEKLPRRGELWAARFGL
jgi:HEAT repeat protein